MPLRPSSAACWAWPFRSALIIYYNIIYKKGANCISTVRTFFYLSLSCLEGSRYGFLLLHLLLDGLLVADHHLGHFIVLDIIACGLRYDLGRYLVDILHIIIQ